MSSVDVFVPCYRYGHFLRECVGSVLTQTDVKVRVLVIDDASPDNTAEVGTDLARGDSRVTFVRHQANRGHIATYNEGLDWVSADYLLLLSADDYLLPGALAQSVRVMDAHPEVGFTFSKPLYSAEGPDSRSPDRTVPFGAEPRFGILTGLDFIKLVARRRATNIVPTPTAVVRTAVQKRVGGYRPELPHTGDLEMWLRLAAHASVGMIDSYQAVFRQHGANMQRGYLDNDWQLPDLKQRKAAFDHFIQSCRPVLDHADQIHARLLRALACDALQVARAAFNAGDLEASRRVSDFAFELSPRARMSLDNALLVFRRILGVKAWSRVRPIVGWGRALLK
jgi:glycosyltransferase involved in cell wall biosynthesis